jgi:hypothetical protein
VKTVLNALRTYAGAHPYQVRSAVAALLVLVGQLLPAVADLAKSASVVDGVTALLLGALAADTARVATKSK